MAKPADSALDRWLVRLSEPQVLAPGHWIPNFLAPRSILMLASLAQVIVLASLLLPVRPSAEFWIALGPATLLAQWIVLFAAAVLTVCTPILEKLSPAWAGVIAVTIAAAIGFGCVMLVQFSQLMIMPAQEIGIAHALRIALICAMLSAAALRYSYVQSQWQQQLQAHQLAKIEALTARIRPHFLFNSMNTLASLIAVDAQRAESVVEDLASLFRAALRSSEHFITVAEELELAQQYLAIESLRLGDRLSVKWDLAAAQTAEIRALKIPPLILQPLVENAVYHGIAVLPNGGRLCLETSSTAQRFLIRITNPIDPNAPAQAGHGMAIENIRARLRLAFHGKAHLRLQQTATEFIAELEFPLG